LLTFFFIHFVGEHFIMKLKHFIFILATVLALLPLSLKAGDGRVILLHIGDIHGHLIPRPHLREGDPAKGKNVGGLANLYGYIQWLRGKYPHSLLINTGDTIQGSAEALYTKGQALVDVLNEFKIDAFAPGNWEFLYGEDRFRELFVGSNSEKPLANWHALAANLYEPILLPCISDQACLKKRVLPPYMIKQIGNVRVGIIGLTAKRGPQIVPGTIVNFSLTDGKEELKKLVPYLRENKKVDLLILISELGLALNFKLVEEVPGVDVVLSSDMHEETWKEPLRGSKNGTWLVEEGQDGTMLGELHLSVKNGTVNLLAWNAHRIISKAPCLLKYKCVPEIDSIIQEVRKPFVKSSFKKHRNPINGSILRTPIDTIVGKTKIPLHRSNFSDVEGGMPAVVEGSPHNFLADAFRDACNADVGIIRGFRYGTHIRPGNIKLEDLYHYIPIGPQIACGTRKGERFRSLLEIEAEKVLSPEVENWGGGWLYGYSGLNYTLDLNQGDGTRVSNVLINGESVDPKREYSIAGYWYEKKADSINGEFASNIQVIREGKWVKDATQVVVSHLKKHSPVEPTLNRIKLKGRLPKTIPENNGNQEIQPLCGVPSSKAPLSGCRN
jgi:sulfur-oxidizing protein SoxB